VASCDDAGILTFVDGRDADAACELFACRGDVTLNRRRRLT
jgi:hypothetical protein